MKKAIKLRPIFVQVLESQAYMDENQSYFRIYALSSFIASGNSGLSELEGIKFAQ